ncbi:hypothetical protein RBH29_11960 [Herbivorax sp. ANBcel31]|uniref:hypothetical protein n=1 Tax=Herbivorax sp. ANBcel31 TaxID=3069754 RepID=UPI0027B302CD|nr:hypothetical protein [Herbivorax sp. ANBcel31]MDQ2087141.1 hypothetical protein [Herbivorax sp. ANBcel31]
MAEYNVMAVVINHRSNKAPKVQEVFTKHGCNIKMRVGLHETENVCSEEGLVLLQVTGNEEEIKSLENQLNDIEGVRAKTLSI